MSKGRSVRESLVVGGDVVAALQKLVGHRMGNHKPEG